MSLHNNFLQWIITVFYLLAVILPNRRKIPATTIRRDQAREKENEKVNKEEDGDRRRNSRDIL
jgi:hypothetical protein